MSPPAVGSFAAALAAAAIVAAICLRAPLPELHLAHPDAGALRDSGWGHGLVAWESIRLAAAGIVLLGCLVTGLPLLLVGAALLAPSIWIRSRAEAARDRASAAVGRVVASAEASLRSGTSLPLALRRAATSCGEPIIAVPIEDAVRAFDLGVGLEAALARSAQTSRDDRARMALGTIALGVAERMPRERLADLLGQIGDRAAFEDQLAGEVRARAAGARQQQRLLALLVPAIAIYLAITVPSLAATLGSDLGRYLLIPAACALEMAGVVVGGRVVRAALR